MNSKSTSHSCSNCWSRSLAVFAITGGPLFKQRMLNAVDQPALVAESEPEDFGRLQLRPDRIGKAPIGCGKHLVSVVCRIRVESHPLLDSGEQAYLLRPGVIIIAGSVNRNNPNASHRRHSEVERVLRDGDADAGKSNHHVVIDGEVLTLHAYLDIDQRHHRTEVRVGSEELVLARSLTDADGDNADSTCPFDARQIPAQLAKLSLILIKLLLCRANQTRAVRGLPQILQLGFTEIRTVHRCCIGCRHLCRRSC